MKRNVRPFDNPIIEELSHVADSDFFIIFDHINGCLTDQNLDTYPRVVFLVDQFQLGTHIFGPSSKYTATKQCSIFELLSIHERNNIPEIKLNVQYSMHASISRVTIFFPDILSVQLYLINDHA